MTFTVGAEIAKEEKSSKDLETANSFYGVPGYGTGFGYYGGGN